MVSDAAANGDAPTPDVPKVKRPRGRPKRADAPVIDWAQIDKLLVHGEAVVVDGSSTRTRRYPSLAELAERCGVTKNRMWQYASKHKCFERRKEIETREQVRYDQIVVARRAEARALGTQDVVQVVDDYIRGFQAAISEGKVRTDSPGDLDRMVRLKELLTGNADSRQELQGAVTLEAIQARHRDHRALAPRLSPAMTGTEGGERVAARPDEPTPALAGTAAAQDLGELAAEDLSSELAGEPAAEVDDAP